LSYDPGECQPVTDEMKAKPILAAALPWRESLDRSCRSGALAAIAPGAALLQFQVAYRYGGERMPVNVSLSPMK